MDGQAPAGTRSVTLNALNESGQPEFVRLLGGVFEHSPWVAERAWFARPFGSVPGNQALDNVQ